MKKMIVLVLFGLIAQSSFASDDRISFGRVSGQTFYGIKHSENFEIACDVKSLEDNGWVSTKLWIDRDFKLKTDVPVSAKNYRVAIGLGENVEIGGAIGVELPVKGVTKARCLNFCAIFDVLFLKDDKFEPAVIQVTQTSSDRFTVLGEEKRSKKTILKGSCALNELP